MSRQILPAAALEHVLARKHYDAEYQQASARARKVLRPCSAISHGQGSETGMSSYNAKSTMYPDTTDVCSRQYDDKA